MVVVGKGQAPEMFPLVVDVVIAGEDLYLELVDKASSSRATTQGYVQQGAKSLPVWSPTALLTTALMIWLYDCL